MTEAWGCALGLHLTLRVPPGGGSGRTERRLEANLAELSAASFYFPPPQVLTADYRYLFAPPQPGGKGRRSTFGAAERHPAYYAEEQLYDARADPAEKLELIVERHGQSRRLGGAMAGAPRAPQAAFGGARLPSAIVRRGSALQIPPRGHAPGAPPRQTHRVRCV